MPDFTSDWFSVRIPTWTRLLAGLCGNLVHCLEIGSLEGRSALWTLENVCSHPDATLTCVDIWSNVEVRRRFQANLNAPAGKVIQKVGPSWRELRKLPPKYYSFVYIDGSHEARDVLEDAVHAFRLTAPGGLICFDDYHWERRRCHRFPKEAIDYFLRLWECEIEVVEKKSQVWIRTRVI